MGSNVTSRPITLVTRGSRLAMWQAERTADLLRPHVGDAEIRIITRQTSADRHQEWNLLEHGGKGLFVKELEDALLSGEADIAVHSLKDMSVHLPEGLVLAGHLKRHEARDTLILRRPGLDLMKMERPRIGTSSQRRLYQLRNRYPHAEFLPIRGNINTRIRKCQEDGLYDAIVLSAVGLERLRLEVDHSPMPVEACVPAPGQGVIALECREDDTETLALIGQVNDPATQVCTEIERAVTRHFNIGCQMPFAAHVTKIEGDAGEERFHLRAGFGNEAIGEWYSLVIDDRTEPGELVDEACCGLEALGLAANA